MNTRTFPTHKTEIVRWKSIPAVALLLTLIVLLLSAGRLKAQVLYGSIVGTVTDQSGAVVPGATVAVSNSLTGWARTAVTDRAGSYSFEDVPSGNYEVTVTARGFRRYSRTDVRAAANGVVRVNVSLSVGAATQSVTVTAGAPPLKTDSSDVSMNLNTRELTNLPVVGERNYQSLFVLVPGFTPPSPEHSIAGNPAQALGFNVNGASYNTNNTLVDGVSSTFIELPEIITYVSPLESIGTVNVVTGSYDAEQGSAAGAVINVETKSGTNKFHGSAYEYNTNSATSARNFFDYSNKQPKHIVNQYGGTFGGPILRNRLFFFGSYEGTRRRQSYNRLLTVPTSAERGGDFSADGAAIYDPLTGNPDGTGRTLFSGGMIPTGRLDPISQKVLSYVPLPNLPGSVNNFFVSAPLRFDRTNYDARIDWNLSSRSTLFGHYSRFDYSVFDTPVFGKGGGEGIGTSFPGTDGGNVQSVAIGGTYDFSPTFLIDSHFAFQHQTMNGHEPDYGQNIGLDVLKIPGTNGPGIGESGFPGFQISGYPGIGDYISSTPRFRHDTQYQYLVNATLIKGSHNLRGGFGVIRQEINVFQPKGGFGPRGGFDFAEGITALKGGPSASRYNALAAFLLGLPSSFGKNIPTTAELTARQMEYDAYFRDRWQISRSLTLNLGVRWEYYPVPTRAEGGMSLFVPSTNQVFIGGLGQVPLDAGIQASKTHFVPRIGVAYRIGNKTVVRTGYGISTDPFSLEMPLLSSYPAIIAQTGVGINSYQPAGQLSTGIPLPTLPDLSSGIVPMPTSVSETTVPKNFDRGYEESYNFTIERELPGGFTAQAGYVGSRTIRLANDVNINASTPGGGLAGEPYYQLFGRRVATTLFDPAFTSDYNSLQTRLNRQFAKGWSLDVSYTYSKAIGFGENDMSGLFFNTAEAISRNRALLGFDRTQNLEISSIAQLPFGKGKRWAHTGALSAIAGGWQINGILSAYSGTPFSVVASSTSLNAPGNSQVADLVEPNVQIFGNIGPGTSYFDPLAFRAVTQPRFGNAGLNILRGPGFFNVDFALFRTFRLTERVALQFRAESSNFTNTPHFGNPSDNVSNMRLNPDGSISSLGGFSSVTSASQDQRQFRFALRISF